MRLRFQSNYLGLSQITLKTQLHAVNARWKRLSQLSFKKEFQSFSDLPIRYQTKRGFLGNALQPIKSIWQS